MKILFCNIFDDPKHYMYSVIHNWLQRLNNNPSLGVSIQPFCTALNVPGMRAPMKLLDIKWKSKDRELLNIYNSIINIIDQYDVIINFGGVNLHPDFVKQLPILKVWLFYDDPESSEEYSRYMSTSHDLCAVGNIASLNDYLQWGNENVFWAPIGFHYDDYDPSLTYDEIISGNRENDIVLLCERVALFRRSKVDKYSLAFPNGQYYGNGWPKGFLPEKERIPLLQNSKIGVNIHNSTGPINFRTFYLPANGVLQICDNKENLGKIFELGKEVIGYNSIEEAIELTRYYLSHEEERRMIAANGFLKAISTYDEISCFRIIVDKIKEAMKSKDVNVQPKPLDLGVKQSELITLFDKFIYFFPKYLKSVYRRLLKFYRNIVYNFKSLLQSD